LEPGVYIQFKKDGLEFERSNSTQKMKVVIGIPCLLRGGTEMQTLLLSKALKELGHKVIVICYHEYLLEMIAEFEALSVEVRLLKWNRKIFPLIFLFKFRQLIQQIKPDVVHIQYIAPGLLPIIASKLANVKKIFGTVHQPGIHYPLYTHWLIRLSAILCNKFTCVSLAVENSWFGNSSLLDPNNQPINLKKHLTIYNCVDVNQINNILNNSNLTGVDAIYFDSKYYIIGSISRLRYEKGIDILIKAFSQVSKQNSNLKLLIIGDGPEKESLSRLAKELGVFNSIIWKGELPWEESIKLLTRMDIVICPSRFEGFGLTAIEALACGKPVIASGTGGLIEIIQGFNSSMLFKSENVQDLTEKLCTYIRGKKFIPPIEIFQQNIDHRFGFTTYKNSIRSLYSIT
jgi:L-malate glycosyltransferase